MDFYLGGLWDMCLNKLCNARILLKKILKVTFRLPLLSTGLSLRFLPKRRRKKIGPGGHPSKYWLGSTLLNFSDRTRTGVLSVIWPLAREGAKKMLFQINFCTKWPCRIAVASANKWTPAPIKPQKQSFWHPLLPTAISRWIHQFSSDHWS